jgi:hypothetical protein
MQLDRGKVVMKDHSSSGDMMMNDDEEPNNQLLKIYKSINFKNKII